MNSIVHLDRLITRSLGRPPPLPPLPPLASFATSLDGLLSTSAAAAVAVEGNITVGSSSSSRSVPPSPIARLSDLPPVPLRRRATSSAPRRSPPRDDGDGGDSSATDEASYHRRLTRSQHQQRRRPSSVDQAAVQQRWLPTRVLSHLWAVLVALALWFSSGKRGMLAFGTASGAGARGRPKGVSGRRRASKTAAAAVLVRRPEPARRGDTDSSMEADQANGLSSHASIQAPRPVDVENGVSISLPLTPADEKENNREAPFPDPRTQAVDPRTQAKDPATVALRSAAAAVAVVRPSLPTPNPTFALLPPPAAPAYESTASNEERITEPRAVVVAAAAPRSRLLQNPHGQTTLLRPTARPSSSSLSPPGSFDASTSVGGGGPALLPNPALRKTTPFHKPKTLILDLDETLIHSTSRPMAAVGPGGSGTGGGFGRWGRGASSGRGRGEGHMVEVFLGGRSTVYHVYKRPYVDYFLKKVPSLRLCSAANLPTGGLNS